MASAPLQRYCHSGVVWLGPLIQAPAAEKLRDAAGNSSIPMYQFTPIAGEVKLLSCYLALDWHELGRGSYEECFSAAMSALACEIEGATHKRHEGGPIVLAFLKCTALVRAARGGAPPMDAHRLAGDPTRDPPSV